MSTGPLQQRGRHSIDLCFLKVLFDALQNVILLAALEQVMHLTVLFEIIHCELGKSPSGSHTLQQNLVSGKPHEQKILWTL